MFFSYSRARTADMYTYTTSNIMIVFLYTSQFVNQLMSFQEGQKRCYLWGHVPSYIMFIPVAIYWYIHYYTTYINVFSLDKIFAIFTAWKKSCLEQIKGSQKECKCIIPRYTHFLIIWCWIYLLMCATYQRTNTWNSLRTQISTVQPKFVEYYFLYILIWLVQYSQRVTCLSLVSIPRILPNYLV